MTERPLSKNDVVSELRHRMDAERFLSEEKLRGALAWLIEHLTLLRDVCAKDELAAKRGNDFQEQNIQYGHRQGLNMAINKIKEAFPLDKEGVNG